MYVRTVSLAPLPNGTDASTAHPSPACALLSPSPSTLLRRRDECKCKCECDGGDGRDDEEGDAGAHTIPNSDAIASPVEGRDPPLRYPNGTTASVAPRRRCRGPRRHQRCPRPRRRVAASPRAAAAADCRAPAPPRLMLTRSAPWI